MIHDTDVQAGNFFINLTWIVLNRGGGEGLKWQEGYQARPWTHKKHPNHVFFRYENRP